MSHRFAIRESRMGILGNVLKPQDIVICLAIHARHDPGWSQERVAKELGLGASSVNEALARLKTCRLYDGTRKEPIRAALEEFLIHGLKYVWPAERGTTTRGVATGFAAPGLAESEMLVPEPPPVWPFGRGEVRGYALRPLIKTVPLAVQANAELYKLLALVDAVRDGSAREQKMAAALIQKELRANADE